MHTPAARARLFFGVIVLALNFCAHADSAVDVLFSFSPDGTNGSGPNGLLLGSDGNLYGTTYQGGVTGGATNGTIFATAFDGTVTTLAGFQGGDGGGPQSALIEGSDGNFYGTTTTGGKSGFGTIFRIAANGALNTLASFTGTAGNYPYYSSLVEDAFGNFYGTSSTGGKNGFGSIFELTNGTIKTLVSFDNTNGAYPYSGVTLGNDGNFYGTTYGGGPTANFGTIFEMTPAGALTTLAAFAGGENGAFPAAPLLLASDGNFYGTTAGGGNYGFGTVFELATNGALSILASFDGVSGADPSAGLIEAADGSFYGTAYSGGAFDGGTVFLLTTNDVLTGLASLDSSTGVNPASSLIIGPDGNLYGATLAGGSGGGGTIFVVTLPVDIVEQPISQTAVAGAEALFSVFAGGTGASYQWFSSANSIGTTNVTGADSNTLVIDNVSDADDGSYWVVVTNAAGAVTSSVVTLTVIDAPVFTHPPLLNTNGSVSLSFTGSSNVVYSVWVSSDLGSSTNWAQLGTATEGMPGFFEFDDPKAAALPERFYQIRWP